MASQNAVNAGVAVQPNSRAIIPALWQKKFIDTSIYKTQVNFDLFKAGLSNEFLKRLIVRVNGTVDTGSATAGTATGLLNPYDLLTSGTLNVSPTPGAGLVPFNQLSGRGLYLLKAINRREFASQNDNIQAIVDHTGSVTVDYLYEFTFQRNHVRKPAEYGFPLSKFTSAVLSLTFGGQTQLYTGSSNTWSFAGLNVDLWGDWDYDSAPAGVHATEAFEQTFPITANGQLLINQLPAGVIYTDLALMTEHNNVPTAAIVDNIDIEGGGRNWTFAGTPNAALLNHEFTTEQFDGTGQTDGFGGATDLDGIYLFPMRGGSFLRGIDARNTQILIKLNVTGWTNSGTYVARLVGRKLTPYGIIAHATKAAASGTPKGKN